MSNAAPTARYGSKSSISITARVKQSRLTLPCSIVLTETLPHAQEEAQPKPAVPPRGGLGLGFFPYASPRPMMGGLASYPAGLADRASAFGRHDSLSYQPVSAWLINLQHRQPQGDRPSVHHHGESVGLLFCCAMSSRLRSDWFA